MAFYDNTWYVNSVKYAAVTVRPQNTAVAAGVIRRQFTAPTVGNERCFVCIVAGTTANVTDATWVITRGAKTTDGTAQWQEITGVPALNGDSTNTPTWATAKATATPSLGAVIKRNNGASYQICTTAGTMAASEPSFSDTAGVTTNDGTSVWTSLGVVGNFTTGGAAPFARLYSGFSLVATTASSQTFYVGSNHAESQATAITISVPATITFLNRVLCHNHAGSYPPAAGNLTTGATISTTGAVNLTISGNGASYFYGIAFIVGVGQSGTAHINLGACASGLILDNCSLQLASTGISSRIFLGGSGAPTYVILNNTPAKFAATAQCFDYGGVGQAVWQNTSPGLVVGSSVPTSLINWNSTFSAFKFTVEAVDLSAITGNLINYTNPLLGDYLFKDCKVSASFTVSAAARTSNNIQLIRCDSGATAYKSSRYTLEGVETTDISVTRAGGAVDPTGQAQSRKIVTTALLSWPFPYKAEPYAIWNSVTGADVTVTLYGIADAAAVPNNDEMWMELEYLGSASSPQGSYATTNKASILATAAAVASDTSDWGNTATARANSTAYVIGNVIKVASNPNRVFLCTTGGNSAGSEPGGYASAIDGGSVTDNTAVFRAGCRFKLTTTLSSPQPGLAGYIHVRPRAAKVSSTFYIDPQIVLS